MSIEFAPRRGLLVPVDAVTEPDAPAPVVVEPRPVDVQEPAQVDRRPARRRPLTAVELAERLDGEREVISVRRADELARRTDDSEHRLALARVRARAAGEQRRLREQCRDEEESAALAELYRRATRAGVRARIRADIQRSAEMRALRVAAVQRAALLVGLPVLAGFAAWSTPGVHAGLVRLLHLEAWSPGWWAAWIVEPLLITVAAGVILVRAVLRSAGGDTDRRADIAEWVALGVSIALNMLGGWRATVGGWSDVPAAIGEALGHSVGAVGAAGTAWLIGVIVDYTSKAEPWRGAPRLADMDLTMPTADGRPDGRPDAINLPKRGGESPAADELPDDVRTLLADVRAAISRGDLPASPSGYAIYRHVMGGRGDKGRAYRVADLVTARRRLEVA